VVRINNFLDKIKNITPGLLLTSLIAFLSIYLASFIPIGPVAIAILIGILINNVFFDKENLFKSGISFSEKNILSLAIVLLGLSLDFNIIKSIPINSMAFILILITTSLLICYFLGLLFGISKNLSILIGIGNGICGSSAIAGASKIIDVDEDEIGVSTTIINAIGALSIFILPYILVNFFTSFSDENFGFVIGSTIQAVGQVAAAGFIINETVGEYSTLIKMIRILMLGPALLLIVLLSNKSKQKQVGFILPPFIVGFIFMSFLVSFKLIPNNILLVLNQLSKIFLIIAMAGIGLNISFKSIAKFGARAFFVAFLSFFIQVVFALIIVSSFL
jgi:uncharacterized integral membrane protein (TIGR00698 family)